MADFINFEADIEDIGEDDGDEVSDISDISVYEVLEDTETFDEISNLCAGSEEESEIDNFNNVEVDIKKFNETLFPRVDVEDEKVHNQFSCAILYALRFDKTGFKDKCDKEEFERNIDQTLFEKLYQPEKFEFILDLQKFHNMYLKLMQFYQNTIIF